MTLAAVPGPHWPELESPQQKTSPARSAQEAGEWGDRVVEKLAKDLRAAFPSMSGFSRTNLFYMRQVHLVWADAGRSVQQLVGQLPWGHHLVLVAKVTDVSTREWYASKAVEHGWSRAVLVAQIESRLHKRAGKALTNFTATLPAAQSDLAHETLKDPYVFDFLTLGPDAQERELEQGLALRARVQNGRIVLDEPTDLPEGTVLELVPGVGVDDLADDDRDKLHAAVRRGLEQGRRGEARPIDEALTDIRSRR